MVTSTASGKQFILESFQELLTLGGIEARISRSHFEDYAFTVPIELNEISERINTLALKKLTGDEEAEFRTNIKACQSKRLEIQESLNNAHEVIGESLLQVVQDFVSDNDMVNLSWSTIFKTFQEFKKHIANLEKVNSSSKAADHIKSVKDLIEKNESNSFDITTCSSSSQNASSTTSSSSFSEASSSPSASSNSFTSSFSEASSSPSAFSNSFTSSFSEASSSPSWSSTSSSSSVSSSSTSCLPKRIPKSKSISSDSEDSSDEEETALQEYYKNTSLALDRPLTAFLNFLSPKSS
jgi:hypothetical protein